MTYFKGYTKKEISSTMLNIINYYKDKGINANYNKDNIEEVTAVPAII